MSGGKEWSALVLSSFAPTGEGALVHREGEVDWSGTWARFVGAMNLRARFGAWLAIAICMSAPLWALGRLRTLAGVSPEDRARALDRMLSHRLFVFRELTLLAKVCACLAMFRSSEVRARTNYDGPQAIAKPRLPIAATEAA